MNADCAVFSQFLGAGVGGGGECTGEATITVGEQVVRDLSEFRCVDPRTDGSTPGPARLTNPARASASVHARARDPIGRPPSPVSGGPGAPDWALVVWRDVSGATCWEAGQVLPGEAVRGYAAFYDGRRPRRGEVQDAVGSLRPDEKFGVGRQFFGLGRFLPYPIAEGGTCGRAPRAGVAFTREWMADRPDLGPARTVIGGIAGNEVCEVRVAGRTLELSPRRAFLRVLRGHLAPRRAPVEIRACSGGRQRFTG